MAAIDDWFDERTLMELVPIEVYVRGASAVEAGAVRIITRTESQLLTSVEAGDDVVGSEWSMDGEQLTFACTCGDANERPCEHLIASALATWPGEAPDEEG
ncbi:MAG: hypothetical protein GX624_09500 [Actinobacteria bacterium]|nr:hypothetical protein [Actinomycetota bacterium]